MGAIVVYTKLNPYAVMVHFMASIPLVVDAVVLLHRCEPGLLAGLGPPAGAPAHRAAGTGPARAAGRGAGGRDGGDRGRPPRRVVPGPAAGQAAAGAVAGHGRAALQPGPAAGRDGAVPGGGPPRHGRPRAGAPGGPHPGGVLVLQAAVGYTQYFTHLPALLVEVHVLGAVVLVVGTIQFFLSLTWHPPEEVPATDVPGAEAPPRRARDADRPDEGAAQGAAAQPPSPEGVARRRLIVSRYPACRRALRRPRPGTGPHRLVAQDAALSRLKHGFESRWGHVGGTGTPSGGRPPRVAYSGTSPLCSADLRCAWSRKGGESFPGTCGAVRSARRPVKPEVAGSNPVRSANQAPVAPAGVHRVAWRPRSGSSVGRACA